MTGGETSPTGSRLTQLRELIAGRGLDKLLVGNLVNVKYLSGFTGSNAVLLVGADEAVLLTDFRYLTQAAEQAPGFELIDGATKPREALAARFNAAATIGFDDADMRVQAHAAWIKVLPKGAQLVPAAGLVEQLREVKQPAEIEAIAAAAEVADSIYSTLAQEGLKGRTERDIAWRIEQLARERGATGLSFPPIVATGSHGALPHAEPRDVAITANQLVVLDLGVIFDGYCSDATRTFATGELADEQRAVYDLVLEAQLAGLAVVAPGASCSAVDAAARSIIAEAGYGEQFGHSLGHGVGIEVHELPTLSARSEAELSVGNVVTVEPGVYMDGEFGVRIEDLVVVQSGAPRILSKFDKQLTVVD